MARENHFNTLTMAGKLERMHSALGPELRDLRSEGARVLRDPVEEDDGRQFTVTQRRGKRATESNIRSTTAPRASQRSDALSMRGPMRRR